MVDGMANGFFLFIFYFHTHGIRLLVIANRITAGPNNSRLSALWASR
jgi:hypothetical protein